MQWVVYLNIDHNMVIIYNYGMQNQLRQQTNAPHLLAILMAIAMRRYSTDTEHTNQCILLRASIEATGGR